MNKIFLTSDLHFGHDKDFIWGPRGYGSIKEHDTDIIRKWNNKVEKTDDIFILGDLMLGDNEQGMKKIEQLNGHLHIILGNHDTNTRVNEYMNCIAVHDIQYALMQKYKKYSFFLCHYPTHMGNYDMQMARQWCLHGHTHSKEKFCEFDKNYNVALDAHNNEPVEIEEVLKDIQEKWNKIYQSRIHNS